MVAFQEPPALWGVGSVFGGITQGVYFSSGLRGARWGQWQCQGARGKRSLPLFLIGQLPSNQEQLSFPPKCGFRNCSQLV